MPAILSRVFAPALRRLQCNGVCFVRMISVPSKPSPATHIVEDPRGFLRYQRNVSKDPNAQNPVQLGNTPYSFLTRRLGHAFEIYPLFVIVGFWVCVALYSGYIATQKIEVWFDRSNSVAPYSWERVRDKYWKLHTTAVDHYGNTHNRLEIMERLQDQMLDASKKRHAQ